MPLPRTHAREGLHELEREPAWLLRAQRPAGDMALFRRSGIGGWWLDWTAPPRPGGYMTPLGRSRLRRDLHGRGARGGGTEMGTPARGDSAPAGLLPTRSTATPSWKEGETASARAAGAHIPTGIRGPSSRGAGTRHRHSAVLTRSSVEDYVGEAAAERHGRGAVRATSAWRYSREHERKASEMATICAHGRVKRRQKLPLRGGRKSAGTRPGRTGCDRGLWRRPHRADVSRRRCGGGEGRECHRRHPPGSSLPAIGLTQVPSLMPEGSVLSTQFTERGQKAPVF